MITIEVLSEQKEQIPKYPYVGKHPNDAIVLFTSTNTGIYLSGGINYVPGQYKDSWCENEFQPIDITIKSTI